ncbi:MAG: ATP-binding cassette domain-containing protein [Bacteroidetes bacterium]|nr:ATP-binding cassette domain-containing protein [Bacteroidota bacterium]
MLEINNLHVSIDNKKILNGFSLTVNAGEVHAIMGPNGTGKSTLANILAGKEGYEIEEGIPGVSNANFLKAAVNEKRKYEGLEPMPANDLLKMMREKMALVEMKSDFISRSVNEGFSGGEKRKTKFFKWLCSNQNYALWTKRILDLILMHSEWYQME